MSLCGDVDAAGIRMPLHRFAGTIRRNKHRDDRAHGRLQNSLAQNDVRAGEPSRRWEARWNKWKGQAALGLARSRAPTTLEWRQGQAGADLEARGWLYQALARACCAKRAALAPRQAGHAGPGWTDRLLARRPTNVVLVAMANKTARVAWALLRYERIYRPTPA